MVVVSVQVGSSPGDHYPPHVQQRMSFARCAVAVTDNEEGAVLGAGLCRPSPLHTFDTLVPSINLVVCYETISKEYKNTMDT